MVYSSKEESLYIFFSRRHVQNKKKYITCQTGIWPLFFPKTYVQWEEEDTLHLQVVNFSLAIHISHASFKKDGENIIFSKI